MSMKILVLLMCLLLCCDCNGAIINVDLGLNFSLSSINTIIDEANAGDVIQLSSGVVFNCDASVVVDKSIVINGTNSTYIMCNDYSPNIPVFSITAACNSAQSIEISNVYVSRAFIGFQHVGSCSASLYNVKFDSCRSYSISVTKLATTSPILRVVHSNLVNGNNSCAFFSGGSVSIEYSYFYGCSSPLNGAGVLARDGARVNVSSCCFDNCRAAAWGGGVFASAGNTYVVVRDTILTSNAAYSGGGGLFNNENSRMEAYGCRFRNNTAGASGGGGVCVTGGNAVCVIDGCTFLGSTGSGTIYGSYYASVTIRNKTEIRTSSNYAVFNWDVASMSVDSSCVFCNNPSGSTRGSVSGSPSVCTGTISVVPSSVPLYTGLNISITGSNMYVDAADYITSVTFDTKTVTVNIANTNTFYIVVPDLGDDVIGPIIVMSSRGRRSETLNMLTMLHHSPSVEYGVVVTSDASPSSGDAGTVLSTSFNVTYNCPVIPTITSQYAYVSTLCSVDDDRTVYCDIPLPGYALNAAMILRFSCYHYTWTHSVVIGSMSSPTLLSVSTLIAHNSTTFIVLCWYEDVYLPEFHPKCRFVNDVSGFEMTSIASFDNHHCISCRFLSDSACESNVSSNVSVAFINDEYTPLNYSDGDSVTISHVCVPTVGDNAAAIPSSFYIRANSTYVFYLTGVTLYSSANTKCIVDDVVCAGEPLSHDVMTCRCVGDIHHGDYVVRVSVDGDTWVNVTEITFILYQSRGFSITSGPLPAGLPLDISGSVSFLYEFDGNSGDLPSLAVVVGDKPSSNCTFIDDHMLTCSVSASSYSQTVDLVLVIHYGDRNETISWSFEYYALPNVIRAYPLGAHHGITNMSVCDNELFMPRDWMHVTCVYRSGQTGIQVLSPTSYVNDTCITCPYVNVDPCADHTYSQLILSFDNGLHVSDYAYIRHVCLPTVSHDVVLVPNVIPESAWLVDVQINGVTMYSDGGMHGVAMWRLGSVLMCGAYILDSSSVICSTVSCPAQQLQLSGVYPVSVSNDGGQNWVFVHNIIAGTPDCGWGKYYDEHQLQCITCPAYMTTNVTSATSVTQCVCDVMGMSLVSILDGCACNENTTLSNDVMCVPCDLGSIKLGVSNEPCTRITSYCPPYVHGGGYVGNCNDMTMNAKCEISCSEGYEGSNSTIECTRDRIWTLPQPCNETPLCITVFVDDDGFVNGTGKSPVSLRLLFSIPAQLNLSRIQLNNAKILNPEAYEGMLSDNYTLLIKPQSNSLKKMIEPAVIVIHDGVGYYNTSSGNAMSCNGSHRYCIMYDFCLGNNMTYDCNGDCNGTAVIDQACGGRCSGGLTKYSVGVCNENGNGKKSTTLSTTSVVIVTTVGLAGVAAGVFVCMRKQNVHKDAKYVGYNSNIGSKRSESFGSSRSSCTTLFETTEHDTVIDSWSSPAPRKYMETFTSSFE